MNRTLLLSLLAYGLLLVGLGSLHPALIALATPLLLYLGAGLIYGPRELSLKVSRTLSTDRIPTGQIATLLGCHRTTIIRQRLQQPSAQLVQAVRLQLGLRRALFESLLG